MHGRIIEIGTEVIPEDERLRADWIDMSILDRFGFDFVTDRVNRTSEICSFLEHISRCFECDGESFKAKDPKAAMAEQWFESIFIKFKEQVEQMSLSEFCDDMKSYILKRAIDGWEDYYYIVYDECYYTLPDFIRELFKKPNANTYYIGGVVDYHS